MNKGANFYDVTADFVIENFLRMFKWNASRQQFHHISSFYDDVGVPSFSSRFNCHFPFEQIEICCYMVFAEDFFDQGPTFFEVKLTVLGKQSAERTFFNKSMRIVLFLELGYFE